MTFEQIGIFAVLAGVFGFFVWGRLRYDIVAFGALIVAVFLGVVPGEAAFDGFSNPAVITVAAVLVISRGLSASGAIDRIAHLVVPPVQNLALQIGAMSGFAAILSAAMNNVAALALLMPTAMESAKKVGRSPSLLLMPLSFGSILGGLITLIGTPPNIVIAHYREGALGAPFAMFDFAPVGLAVAAAGVVFLSLVGWRLLPKERTAKSAAEELFEIDDYVAEVVVPEGSAGDGKMVVELEVIADECGARIAGLIRNHSRMLRLARSMEIKAGDILLLETGAEELDKFAHQIGAEIKGDVEKDKALFASEDVVLVEVSVSPDSRIVGRRIGDMRLKSRYGLNLLGVSRQGKPIRKRLHQLDFQAGDILLVQAASDGMYRRFARLGLWPLAPRKLQMGKRHQAWIAISLLAGAVGITALGLTSLTVALATGALGMVLCRIVPLRDLYDSIDWPVIVLVGAMIPIGGALETTGATGLITEAMLSLGSDLAPAVILFALFLVTMTLSDLMNNVATAVMMAPIAIDLSKALGANPDSFLMAVAVAASCAFLTPIGHKNNALVMGPGGYRFSDYWRMGLPLEVLICIVAMPMILWVWPM